MDKHKQFTSQNSAGANGGPCSWVCARLTLWSGPDQHQRNFFGKHVRNCALLMKASHEHEKKIAKKGNPRGVPKFVVTPNLIFFVT